MKVLYLDTPLDPPGGGQMSLGGILANARWETSVFVHRPGMFYGSLRQRGIDCRVVPVFGISAAVKKLLPDIIHSNSAATRYTFAGALAARANGIPFVWHNRVIDTAPLRERIIGGLSSRIVVISDAVGEKFKKPIFDGKVVRIYNAVDTAMFAPDTSARVRLRGEFGIGRDEKVIGVFSRLEKWKGHRLLFEAVAGLAAGGRDARMLVAGAGWSYRLRSVASDFGLCDRAIFTGFRPDVPELMNICDVVVNPSSDPEPFGRTVIEAMSCGKAVVATDMGGHREIIEDGVDGLLSPASPGAFADSLRRVLGDTDLAAALGAAGRRKALERFSMSRQIDEISALYGELV